MTLLFNRLVIAGVGLIGGSLGLAARARGLVGEVIGFGRTEANLQVALPRVRALWEGVGMRVEEMDVGTHDQILARVSHLPHVIAFSVMQAILDARVAGIDLLAYTGSAFADLTRVAASPVEMWRDICLANREALLAALTEFEDALAQMKAWVASGDDQALTAAINRARAERQRLTRLREHA